MSRKITVTIEIEVDDAEQFISDVRERLIEENGGDADLVDFEAMPDPEDNLELVAQHAFDTLGFRSDGIDVIDSTAHSSGGAWA